jgi:tRNA(adenine34) deaminase
MWDEVTERDLKYMREALREAEAAGAAGDVPVGAIVVVGDRIVGRGRNERELTGDPLAHAEIVALRAAAAELGHWRLDEAELFVTLEPCPMCAGAIVQSRLRSLTYGTPDARGGAARSLFRICDDPRTHHRVHVRNGILAEESASLLAEFFRAKRKPRP